MKTLIMQMFVTKTPSGHSGRGTNYRNHRSQTPRTLRVLLLLLLFAYLQTTASYLDKLCVAVRRGDGHGRVQLPLGGHDVQAPGQLSVAQLIVSQCSSVQPHNSVQCCSVQLNSAHCSFVQLSAAQLSVAQLSVAQCSSLLLLAAQCVASVAPCSSGKLARAWEMEFNWKYLKGARKIVQFVCK